MCVTYSDRAWFIEGNDCTIRFEFAFWLVLCYGRQVGRNADAISNYFSPVECLVTSNGFEHSTWCAHHAGGEAYSGHS